MFFHIKMIVKWSISHCAIADYISFCNPFLKIANWAANGLQKSLFQGLIKCKHSANPVFPPLKVLLSFA